MGKRASKERGRSEIGTSGGVSGLPKNLQLLPGQEQGAVDVDQTSKVPVKAMTAL